MLFRMLAVSFISTIKVDSPEEILSEAPTRVKILSTSPIEAHLGRHEAPHLRHERDQGRLTQQGRLTRHVRTCKDDDLLLFIVEEGVVRDIGFARRQILLDHRMTAVAYINGQ